MPIGARFQEREQLAVELGGHRVREGDERRVRRGHGGSPGLLDLDAHPGEDGPERDRRSRRHPPQLRGLDARADARHDLVDEVERVRETDPKLRARMALPSATSRQPFFSASRHPAKLPLSTVET